MSKLTMKAILPIEYTSNAKNMAGVKETIKTLTLVASMKGKIVEVVTARFYMARKSDGASPVYCSLWVHGKASGHGKANGYGYHKTSAALQAAIDSAGIKLMGSNYAHTNNKIDFRKQAMIGGCGDSSMHMALMAIARACGVRGKMAVI